MPHQSYFGIRRERSEMPLDMDASAGVQRTGAILALVFAFQVHAATEEYIHAYDGRVGRKGGVDLYKLPRTSLFLIL